MACELTSTVYYWIVQLGSNGINGIFSGLVKRKSSSPLILPEIQV